MRSAAAPMTAERKRRRISIARAPSRPGDEVHTNTRVEPIRQARVQIYSALSACTGSRPAALFAGWYPKHMPTAALHASAPSTASHDVNDGHPFRYEIVFAVRTPNATPAAPPSPLS